MRLVGPCSIDVVYPRVGAIGGTETIKQIEGSIAAALCGLDLYRDGAAHGLGPNVTALDPPGNLVPLARTSGVTAQPVAVGCFCRLGPRHDG